MMATTTTQLCQTCSGQLTSAALRSAFLPPCCSTPICASCIAHNPRLREYIPCLRCGDLTTREGQSKVLRGRRQQEWNVVDRDGGDLVFDADGDEVDDLDSTPSLVDVASTRRPRSTDGETQVSADLAAEPIDVAKEDELETVEITHPVARSDTLLAIARRYAADPHDLLELNNLPPTALSSNPRILQTRKIIIISRRRVPRSQLDNLAASALQETSLDPEEAKRRAEERAVKRFQLVTKTVDPGVGKAYLSIQAGADLDVPNDGKDDMPHPLELGSGEKLDGKKRAIPQAMSQEDRAVEQWFEDEDWEQERGAKGGLERRKEGKWTSVGGSAWPVPPPSSGKYTEGIKI